jgi:hypothetical protein
VRTCSVGGVNGAATRTAATTRPAAIDVATIAPSLLLTVGGGSGWRSLCWVRVIVTASPRASDLQSQARTACTWRNECARLAPRSVHQRPCAPLASRPSPCSRSLSDGVARLAVWLHRPRLYPPPAPAVVEAPGKALLRAPGLTTFASGRRLCWHAARVSATKMSPPDSGPGVGT